MVRNGGRRRLLKYAGAFTAAGLTGCLGGGDGEGDGTDGNDTDTTDVGENPYYGLGDRPEPGGTSMDDMPDLSGKLTLYLGRGEGGLYQELIDLMKEKYPDFDVVTQQGGSSSLANTVIEEMRGGDSPADVFWSIDAGSLGIVAENGYTRSLPDEVLDMVGSEFRSGDGDWVGTAGRARAVPYNTEAFSEDDIPTSVFDFAEEDRFEESLGWTPSYGAFQAFLTAMRILNGESMTREWLNGVMDQGMTQYPDEFVLSQAVANGEISAGFANHYYTLRVQQSRSNAPLALGFTQNDAGALVNVAGAEVIDSTDSYELASNFVRHLLSSEAQEYFATSTFAYPMVPEVEPVGDIPSIDELNPPEIDLTRLSEIQPTLELMRDVGIKV